MTGIRVFASCIAAALALALAACAPEPSAGIPEDVAGQNEHSSGKGGTGDSWEQPDLAETDKKVAELPQSFPADLFVIPEGAVIDDARERAAGQWYVVLLAQDASAADELWNGVVAAGGFAVSDDGETGDGGRAAMLAKEGLSVLALTIPQEDGTILLSYDIEALV